LSPTPKLVKIAIYGRTLDGHSDVGRYAVLVPAFAGMSARGFRIKPAFDMQHFHASLCLTRA